MTISRDYNCSDMKCLVVCATINESFLANKEPLIAVQSSWAYPYGDNLKSRIQAAGTEFNAIYTEIMAICKIARRVFKDQPEIKAAFSFAKVLKALGK